jgi:hypothetical protein
MNTLQQKAINKKMVRQPSFRSAMAAGKLVANRRWHKQFSTASTSAAAVLA